jgi:hypothetical protein
MGKLAKHQVTCLLDEGYLGAAIGNLSLTGTSRQVPRAVVFVQGMLLMLQGHYYQWAVQCLHTPAHALVKPYTCATCVLLKACTSHPKVQHSALSLKFTGTT